MRLNAGRALVQLALFTAAVSFSPYQKFVVGRNGVTTIGHSLKVDSATDSDVEVRSNEYSSDAITVLKGLEPVRKRPGMYIGSTGEKGLHHLVFEVVDNSVDEALAGHCSEITVIMNSDGSIEVSDNGRGIPCAVHPSTGKSSLETVLCVLHAGGKFGGESSGYRVSGGLHGVGLSVVNALSEELVVEVIRDSTFHTMSFSKGIPLNDIIMRPSRGDQRRGTAVRFRPDPSIFKTTVVFDFDRLATRLDELAYLNAGLTIHLVDKRTKAQILHQIANSKMLIEQAEEITSMEDSAADDSVGNEATPTSPKVVESLIVSRVAEDDVNDGGVRKNVTFRHDGGIKELVKVLCEGKVPLGVDSKASTQNEKKSGSRSIAKKQVAEDADIIFMDEDRKGINVQVAMRWSSDHYVDALTGFANGIRTPDGGSHLDGLKAAITKTVNNYAKKVTLLT